MLMDRGDYDAIDKPTTRRSFRRQFFLLTWRFLLTDRFTAHGRGNPSSRGSGGR